MLNMFTNLLRKVKLRPLLIFSTYLLGSLMLYACQTSNDLPTPVSVEATENPLIFESQPIKNGPILLRDNILLRKVGDVGFGSIKLVINPIDSEIYILKPADGVYRLNLTENASTERVAEIDDFADDGYLTSMNFGPDGALYLVLNLRPSSVLTQAKIYKGILNSEGVYEWVNLATTEPYPASNTNFDHLFTGITISPDNQWVYVSSGSRTDHGEVQSSNSFFPEVREVPLTSAIFRFPTDANEIIIPNDDTLQKEQGLLFADGTRNAYTLVFAPNGDLFGIDNGPDADYPEEINWIREGLHYGFPWRFGTSDNPQQFVGYQPKEDGHLSSDFVAVQLGTYQNDPNFPEPPQSFTDPIMNLGPDGDVYRDDEGNEQDGSETGNNISTLTPHRSPLGLIFLTNQSLPDLLLGDDSAIPAFLLSWGAAGGDLSDQGQDLLHLSFVKEGDSYTVVTNQIAKNFNRPIDQGMIENRLYVLEWDGDGTIWELTFE